MVDESGDNDSVGWPRIRPVDAAATAVPVPTSWQKNKMSVNVGQSQPNMVDE